MADVTSNGGRDRRGSKPRSRKQSTRIDMTAMVDVAFLLLTFFVLTATMVDKHLMEMVVPPCEGDECYKKIDGEKILTLVLEEENVIKYYVGITEPDVQQTDYDEDGLRKVVSDFVYGNEARLGVPLCTKIDNNAGRNVPCWDPIIVVKAKPKSKYKNLVDTFDELAILQAPKYTIAPYTINDSLLIAQAE